MSSQQAFPTLQTDRLILREILLEDATDLFNYYNDREVTQYLDWFGPSSVDHARDIISNWNEQFQQNTFMRWGITLKGANKIIGTIPMNPVRGPFEWKLPMTIGYELSREYWNQGIMTEALQAIIPYIFNTLNNHRICAEVFPENTASLHILKKLGFEKEGYLVKHLWHDGTKTWHDVIMQTLMRAEKLPAPTSDIHNKLELYMNKLDRRGYINGSVLVAYQGHVLLNKGYGMANIEHDIPNTPQTKFSIGSITKGFTAVAIMQLQERQLLNVQDYIAEYLGDYPNGDKITIHQLLTHTSGVPNHTTSLEFWDTSMRHYSPTTEAVIQLFIDMELDFQPGERFGYSNAGYILLTAIIEKVSGLSYGAYLRKHILDPLGMTNTAYYDGRTLLNNRASGYSVWKNMISPEHEDMSNALGACGIYSTVEDLYLWNRAVYTDQILSFDSLENIFTTYHEYYGGYGWHIVEQEINGVSRKRVGHIGDINGFNANFIRYPDDDLVVILLSNVSITPVEQISEDLARVTLGEAIPVLEDIRVIDLSDEDYNKCTGLYRERENESNEIVITHEDGKLYMEMSKRYGIRYKYELVPVQTGIDALEFITTIVEEKIQLFLNEQGDISYLRYYNIYGNVEVFDKNY